MRFVSIIAIVALGISFFVGIKSASPDMQKTANEYFLRDNLIDIQVISTIGFTDDEIQKISQINGINAIGPVKFTDTLVYVNERGIVNAKNGAAMTCRVGSMNFQQAKAYSQTKQAPDDYINRLTLVDGRYPENTQECVVDDAVVMAYPDLTIGNIVTLGGDRSTLSDSLNTEEFVIVGTVSTPEYVSFERGVTNVGSGTLGMYMYIDESCFVSPYYTSALVVIDNKASFDVYSDEYKEYVKAIGDKIESISQTSISARLADVKKEYNEKIQEGEKVYNELEKETTKQLEEALEKINVIEKYIANGDSEISSAKERLESKITSAQQELDSSKAEYEQSLEEYENNKTLANAAGNEIDGYNKAKEIYDSYLAKQEKDKAEIERLKKSLPELKADADQKKAKNDSAQSAYSSKAAEIPKKEKELSDAQKVLKTFKDEEENWNAETSVDPLEVIKAYVEEFTQKCNKLQGELDSLKAELAKLDTARINASNEYIAAQDEYNALKATIASKEKVYESNKEILSQYEDDIERLKQGETDLGIFKNALEEARKELEASKIKITQSQLKLYYEKSSGGKQIESGEADLKAARSRLEAAEEAYAAAEHEIKVNLKKAQGDIDKARLFLEELNRSAWRVSYQDDLPGHEGYAQSLENITAISNVFPVFFFVIAALMCLVTMTRMVQEERMQLGTLKALGYSKNKILSKYYWYAALACLAGSALGVAVGVVIFPKVINSAYAMMYRLPDVNIYFNWSYIIIGTAFSLISTLLATAIACRKELKTQAAELMRPRSPKPGKSIFLERFTTLWQSMSFGSIVTVRNMFRSKKRLIMTIVGVAGCTTLILAAFGISNSIEGIISAQYGENGISYYDLMVVLDTDQIPGESETVKALKEDIRVADAMLLNTASYTAFSANEEVKVEHTASVYVPETKEKLSDFISLKSRKGKEVYTLNDDGAIITEKLAADTQTKIGDLLMLKDSKGNTYQVKVSAIVENYVYHYVYISPSYYQNVFGNDPEFDYVSVILKDYANDRDAQNIADDILSYNEVSGIVSTDVMVESFNTIIDRLDIVVIIFILAAGLLAIVVLYNLTNISVQERLREIATIKVVGFTDAEVTAYVYRENIFLTITGILFGLFGGVLLHKIVVNIAEVNVVMFGRNIYWWSYLVAIILTAVFAAGVSLLVHKRLQKLDVISALKSVE